MFVSSLSNGGSQEGLDLKRVVSFCRFAYPSDDHVFFNQGEILFTHQTLKVIRNLFIDDAFSQAFVHKFSEDLALEYAPFGVTVQCVLPGFVATNMSRIKRPSMKVPTPTAFVQGQMKTWGLELSSAGYWVHKLQVVLSFT